MSMNIEAAREQMIGQQVRTWEVLDERVLRVLRSTHRESFVPAEYRDVAFADTEIPLGNDQAMMTPMVEGRLLQALAIESIDDVLEIGTGSGYLTACLAQLGASVKSVDVFPEFTESAAEKLAAERLRNVDVETRDGLTLNQKERFDVIAVTASAPAVPSNLVEMLKVDGRMFIVVGRAPVMEALIVRRLPNGSWSSDSLFETYLTPLLNIDLSEPFQL